MRVKLRTLSHPVVAAHRVRILSRHVIVVHRDGLTVPHDGVGVSVAGVEVSVRKQRAAFAVLAIDSVSVERVAEQIAMAAGRTGGVGEAITETMIVILAGPLRMSAARVLDLVRRGVTAAGVERVVERGAAHRETDHSLPDAAG